MSVVIPCYRYGHFLEAAVDSVLLQEDVDVEVVVIDDASDDDSAAVARSIAARDNRVRVIVHERNAGHIATYNEGLAHATGEYVVLLSADDALNSGCLARAVALMQRFPRVGMVYGHAESFTDELPQIDAHARSWTTWDGSTWLARMCAKAVNPVYTPSVVMRRSAWQQIGTYDHRVPHAADMLLWFQCAAGWDIGRVNNRAQAFYRVHGSNMHLTQFAGMLRDLQEQREVIRILFEEPLPGESPPESVRTEAHRTLVRRARRLELTERRELGDAPTAPAYQDFARESIAGDSRSAPRPWQHGFDEWIESRSATFARRVARHLQWRRWRRYGV